MSFHRNHWLLLSTILFGFIALGTIVAIAPAYWVQLQAQTARTQSGIETLSEKEQRGLAVYIAEGCVACHTQQVRPIAMDSEWGRPSAPSDYVNLGGGMDLWRPYTPAVLGSARNGPDLSNIGNRQSSRTWQYLHLYNPRTVAKDSFMPAYPWLFNVTEKPDEDATIVHVPEPYGPKEGKVVPTEEGQALVAYLLSLKQSRQQTQSQSGASAGQSGSDQTKGKTKADTGTSNGLPPGGRLYGQKCASCHQDSGKGVPNVFPSLVGNSVVTAQDPQKHIMTVLEGAQGRTINGKKYPGPMPGFADQLSDAEIAAIVNHERTSWGNKAPTVTVEEVSAMRNKESK